MMKQFIRCVAGAAIVLFSAGLTTGALAQSQVEVVKLGLAAPMTGPQALYGKDFQSGVLLAIDDFNATNPKIAGKDAKFELISVDDQADPKTGTVVAQRLVDEGVKGILGHVNSGVSIPASSIYSKAGLPQISISSAPAYTRQGFHTTFRMATSDVQQGGAMGRFAVEVLKAKRIVIIDDETAYGQGLAEQFEAAVKSAGGAVIDHQFTNDKAIDFKAILTRVKSEDPDLIYYAGADAQSAPMVKQARSLAIRTNFASGDMTKSDAFLKITGKAGDGTLVSLAGLPLDQMPGGGQFTARYKAKFGTEPTTYSPYSYDGAMAMMKSMVQANSSDPKIYLPVLAKIDMKGVTTDHFTYDQYGDLREVTVTVYKADAGHWVPLKVLTSN
jgi:branched-chain amino acid transport system substrate-binding protein